MRWRLYHSRTRGDLCAGLPPCKIHVLGNFPRSNLGQNYIGKLPLRRLKRHVSLGQHPCCHCNVFGGEVSPTSPFSHGLDGDRISTSIEPDSLGGEVYPPSTEKRPSRRGDFLSQDNPRAFVLSGSVVRPQVPAQIRALAAQRHRVQYIRIKVIITFSIHH